MEFQESSWSSTPSQAGSGGQALPPELVSILYFPLHPRIYLVGNKNLHEMVVVNGAIVHNPVQVWEVPARFVLTASCVFKSIIQMSHYRLLLKIDRQPNCYLNWSPLVIKVITCSNQYHWRCSFPQDSPLPPGDNIWRCSQNIKIFSLFPPLRVALLNANIHLWVI